MSERMKLIEEGYAVITKYSQMKPWRPGLIDLYVYDIMVGMYESDYEDVDSMTWIWTKKPDEIMEHLIEDTRIFDLEFGWEALDEDVRDYLSLNGFIIDIDNVTEEELKQNLERK